jgi:hypothetical protein
MFVLQAALYGLGFALLVLVLEAKGRRVAAVFTALIAISPLLLGWQMVVLKDAQMLGAMIAAFGTIAYFRLQGRRIPGMAAAILLVLLAYATLVRANALFATVPLAVFLLPRPKSPAVRLALAFVCMVLLLAVEPIINHRLFDASSSGVAKSQPLFDLAAIAVAVPTSVAPFGPSQRSELIKRHCVTPFFWDPVGDPSACGPVTESADALSEKELYLDLLRAAATHPFVYAVHRVRHWNSTERWLVRPGLISAGPPNHAEPNDEGLAGPGSGFVSSWQDAAAFEARTPLGWPITWTCVALLLVPVAWRRRSQQEGALALALLVSSIILEASFLVISIASDLRYHLWSMTSVPLALVLLPAGWRDWRRHYFALIVLVIVVGAGVYARMTLPQAPAGYQAMLHGIAA